MVPAAPSGLAVVADPNLRREDGGRVVVGGSPARIMRLSDEGAERLDGWLRGEPVSEASSERRLARRLLDAGLVHPRAGRARGEDELTVVVPVRDDPAGLERVLRTLATGHRAIVVDDGSADGAAHQRLTDGAGAAYLRQAPPTGPGAARNRGLEMVDTALVAFVDADVTVDAPALSALTGHFDDPAVVAVAPRVRSVDGTGALARYEAAHSPLDLGDVPSPVGPGRRVSYLPAACLVARTQPLRAIGGFDAALRWGEDVDLVWRLVGAGHTVRYEPAIEVGHRPRASLGEWAQQRRRYGSSAAPLAARHGSAVAPARCSPWSVAVWAAVVAGHPLVGLGVAGGSTAALASKLRPVPEGRRLAVRLGLLGHLHAGLGLVRAAGREWWPLTAALAATSRRGRALLAGVVAVRLVDSIREPRSGGAVETIALGTADDLAYGFGVWEGMWRARSAAAIEPDLVVWPDRDDLAGAG